MEPLRRLSGPAAPLFEHNIDTDQLCPKVHLKRLTRSGFAQALFSDRRYDAAGAERPDFVLNQAPWRQAVVLIAGDNFGSGSSREHAVWALADFGIRCVIAPSFGDIFFQNTVNSGLLAIRLPLAQVAELAALAQRLPGAAWEVDLERQAVLPPGAEPIAFAIEPSRRQRLLEGLDEIGMTLRHRAAVEAFEARQRAAEPWLWQPLRS